MIEELRLQELKKQIDEEAKNLEGLKTKMDTIRTSALALNRGAYKKMSHDDAIRRGGYFMFKDDEKENRGKGVESQQSVGRKINFKDLQEKDKLDTSSEEGEASSRVFTAIVMENTSTVKRFLARMLWVVLLRMHKLSRNYRYILSMMEMEKKNLTGTVTPGGYGSNHSM